MRRQRGFSLLEVAIVIVILGLLLGSVLKGEELITSARVRNLISLQEGIKAAYLGFNDRYRALPGDYNQAVTYIAGMSTGACTGNGDGDGRIETAGGNTPGEHILVWEHLYRSGFINGSYACVPAGAETGSSTPTNPFGVRMQLVWDNVYDPVGQPARHNLKIGSQIPSDILAEIDRKIDDGSATAGMYRFSAYDGGAGSPTGPGSCYEAAAPHRWNSGSTVANCGAVLLF